MKRCVYCRKVNYDTGPAHKRCKERAEKLEENLGRITNPDADMEQITSNAAFSANESAPQDTRVNITVRSYRRLNTDPDGISAKAALDGIVERGILTDDSSEQIARFTSEVIKSKEEKTIIEIEFADELERKL